MINKGWFPLVSGLVMLLFAALFWYVDASARHDAMVLAQDVTAFLENHRTESTSHKTAYQQAKQLSNVTQGPNRTPLCALALVCAAQFFGVFRRSAMGTSMVQGFIRIWTWRP